MIGRNRPPNDGQWKPWDVIIALLAIIAVVELLMSPHPYWAKQHLLFPAINIGVRFTVSELCISGLIVLGIAQLVIHLSERGRIYLGPSYFRVWLFLVLVCTGLSVMLGVVNRNAELLLQARQFLIPGAMFIIFLNMDLRQHLWNFLVRTLFWSGCLAAVIALLWVVDGRFVAWITVGPQQSYWFAIYLSVFSLIISMRRLLADGFSFLHLLVVALVWITVFVYLAHKPIVFAATAAYILVCGLAIVRGPKVIRRRGWLALVSVPTILGLVLYLLPSALQTELISVFSRRFLKAYGVESTYELARLSSLPSLNELAGGRIDIWTSYLRESLSGFGLAPKGFGATAPIRFEGGLQEGFPAHSTIAYLSFHIGLIGAMVYLVLLGIVSVQIPRKVLKPNHSQNRHPKEREVPFGVPSVYVFIITIALVGLGGGPMQDYRIAYFVWFFAAWLVSYLSFKTQAT